MAAGDGEIVPTTIELSESQYQDLKRELAGIPGGVTTALRGAINKTIAQGRTIVVDEILEKLATRRGVVRSRVHGEFAQGLRLTGTIQVGGKPIALANFQAHDTRPKVKTTHGKKKVFAHYGDGVEVQIYRDGATANLPRAFVAVLGGKKQVLQRRLAGGGGGASIGGVDNVARVGDKLVGRTPIKTLGGPSAREVFEANPSVEQAALKHMGEIYGEQVLSQIDRLLNRRKADRGVSGSAEAAA